MPRFILNTSFCLSLVLFGSLQSQTLLAQIQSPRMSEGQIRSQLEMARNHLKQETNAKKKKEQLKALKKALDKEYLKGAKSYDKTFVYINATMLTIDYLLFNDCKKSRELIVLQSPGQDTNPKAKQNINQEIREGLALHEAYCGQAKKK